MHIIRYFEKKCFKANHKISDIITMILTYTRLMYVLYQYQYALNEKIEARKLLLDLILYETEAKVVFAMSLLWQPHHLDAKVF